MADTLQTGKTRWCHYQTAYHFVWIPKYRRRVLTGEVRVAAKAALEACCAQHGFTLLALETDEDHAHCFVSAPPRWAPATIVGLLKGYSSGPVSGPEEALRQGVALDQRLLRRHRRLRQRCGYSALYHGVSGQVADSRMR